MEDFYKKVRPCADGEMVEYEIIPGNRTVVFIKAGAGGSARGRNGKYAKMAQRVHTKLGATVICASNPDAAHESLDEKQIREVVNELKFDGFELFFVGTSDGAYHNLSLAKRFRESARMLGINVSYIDSSDLESKLKALPDVHKTLVFGTKDDDLGEILPVLENMQCDKLAVQLIKDADHGFSSMTEDFIALIDYLCQG